MSMTGLAFETFGSDGRTEWLMRIGAENAPPILFVPPLFEEMNRTRALLASVMRRLAAQGFGCWLPDLSGTGESEQDLGAAGWHDWRHDVTSAPAYVTGKAGRPLIASVRGGVLIDDEAIARGWWRFAPVDGPALQRDMVRAGLAGVEWAGYALGRRAESRAGRRHRDGGDAAADRAAGDRCAGGRPQGGRTRAVAALGARLVEELAEASPRISPHGAVHAPPDRLSLRRRDAGGSLDIGEAAQGCCW